jgi:hypothetical protein
MADFLKEIKAWRSAKVQLHTFGKPCIDRGKSIVPGNIWQWTFKRLFPQNSESLCYCAGRDANKRQTGMRICKNRQSLAGSQICKVTSPMEDRRFKGLRLTRLTARPLAALALPVDGFETSAECLHNIGQWFAVWGRGHYGGLTPSTLAAISASRRSR